MQQYEGGGVFVVIFDIVCQGNLTELPCHCRYCQLGDRSSIWKSGLFRKHLMLKISEGKPSNFSSRVRAVLAGKQHLFVAVAPLHCS